jgi:hypothetical protein
MDLGGIFLGRMPSRVLAVQLTFLKDIVRNNYYKYSRRGNLGWLSKLASFAQVQPRLHHPPAQAKAARLRLATVTRNGRKGIPCPTISVFPSWLGSLYYP